MHTSATTAVAARTAADAQGLAGGPGGVVVRDVEVGGRRDVAAHRRRRAALRVELQRERR